MRWCRSFAYLSDPLVDGDGDDDEHAHREGLPEHVESGEREAVAEDADDEGAEERAPHRAAAAEEARAADHDGRDRVEVEVDARVRRGGVGASDLDPRADRE